MIIENWALWMARSLASSHYNHRVTIITLKASSFQNGSQLVDVSESEIDQFKENAVPQKTKDATKFRVKLFKGSLIKFLFCK